jgi:hypothetical protein
LFAAVVGLGINVFYGMQHAGAGVHVHAPGRRGFKKQVEKKINFVDLVCSFGRFREFLIGAESGSVS